MSNFIGIPKVLELVIAGSFESKSKYILSDVSLQYCMPESDFKAYRELFPKRLKEHFRTPLLLTYTLGKLKERYCQTSQTPGIATAQKWFKGEVYSKDMSWLLHLQKHEYSKTNENLNLDWFFYEGEPKYLIP